MKIVVDTPEDFKKWLAEKPTLSDEVKAAKATPAPAEGAPVAKDSSVKPTDTAATAKAVAVK